MTPKIIVTLGTVGVLLVVAGIAVMYWPAAVVAVGLAAVAASLLLDDGL